jgi:hypothetical protein
MDLGEVVVKPVRDFAKNSARLVKRCTKPDRKGVASGAAEAADRLQARAGRNGRRRALVLAPCDSRCPALPCPQSS